MAGVLAAVMVVVMLYCLARTAGRVTRAAYLRIGVGCVAMAAMLLPAATASAAAPAAAASAPGMAGMPGMGGLGHAVPAGGRPNPGVLPPTVLLALLLAALGVVLVVRLLGSLRSTSPVPSRLDAGCDVAMAAAMGYMLALML